MPSRSPTRPMFAALAVTSTLALVLLGSAPAAAEDAISAPAAPRHAAYRFEIDPHLLYGTLPPGFGQGSGVGAGIRGSVVILPNGLFGGVDSLAIGFGLDYGRYFGKWGIGGYHELCLQRGVGTDGADLCTEITTDGGTFNYLFVPVVLQWNFWLAPGFSMFIEPGVNVYHLSDRGTSVVPAGYLGFRIRLSEGLALIGRLGYPTAGLGVSFTL